MASCEYSGQAFVCELTLWSESHFSASQVYLSGVSVLDPFMLWCGLKPAARCVGGSWEVSDAGQGQPLLVPNLALSGRSYKVICGWSPPVLEVCGRGHAANQGWGSSAKSSEHSKARLPADYQ